MCSINYEKKQYFFIYLKKAGTFIRENLEKYYWFKYYQIRRPYHDELCKTSLYIDDVIKNYVKHLYIDDVIKKYHSGDRIYGIIKFFKNKPHSRNIGIYEYSINSDYINKITNMNEKNGKNIINFVLLAIHMKDLFLAIITL
jgi:CRISPR/Cas system CSM-associated protein Csm3 (group 7 of RAMP superfamily)